MSHWQNKKEHVKRQFEMVLQLHVWRSKSILYLCILKLNKWTMIFFRQWQYILQKNEQFLGTIWKSYLVFLFYYYYLLTYLVKRHRRPDVFKIFPFDLIFWIFKFQTTHIVSHEEAFSRCIWYSCYSYAQVAVSCNCFTFDLLFLCYNWNGMFWTYGSEELLY